MEVFKYNKLKIVLEKDIKLSINPENKKPIIFVPKRWLRKNTWISYEDYFKNFFVENVKKNDEDVSSRIEILNYNMII